VFKAYLVCCDMSMETWRHGSDPPSQNNEGQPCRGRLPRFLLCIQSRSIQLRSCIYVFVYSKHMYIRIYIYTYIHTSIHACMHACIHTLHYITLHCIALHYITLHYITLHTYIQYIYKYTYILYLYACVDTVDILLYK